MTSPYRQSSYETPYSAAVPSGVGNSMDDDFSNSRPQFLDESDVPVPGFAFLQEKWLAFEPDGESLLFAGVDTRTQMAVMRVQGLKAWCAMYQALPLPTVIGPTGRVELAIYLRCMFGSGISLDEEENNDIAADYGLLLGDAFTEDPQNSQIIQVGLSYERGATPGAPPAVSSGTGVVNVFPTWDSGFSDEARLDQGPWPGVAYFRVRLRQELNGEDDYTWSLRAEMGAFGNDWFPCTTLQGLNAALPLRAVGFGMRAQNNAECSAFFDLFKVVEQAYDDATPMIGSVQQLGAP